MHSTTLLLPRVKPISACLPTYCCVGSFYDGGRIQIRVCVCVSRVSGVLSLAAWVYLGAEG